MKKYRLETLAELKARIGNDYIDSYPFGFNDEMEEFLGSELPEDIMSRLKNGIFRYEGWTWVEESIVEINEEPITINTKIKNEMSKFKNWEYVRQNVSKRYVKADDVIDIIELGIETGKNVFLYGKGGHGKSEITEDVFKELQVEPFIQSCGDGLTEEKLFGGLNLKIFQDTGDIYFNVENSFMNHEYVILEEFLDAPMNVLLSLKDILTSGEFRQGSQRFKIKTKCVIALTNRTKEEVSEDDSIKALMERFPLGKLVEWETYSREDFMELFVTVKPGDVSKYKREMQVLSNIIAKSIEKGQFISPRTAIHCLDVVIKAGFEKLIFIDGLDGSMVKETLDDFKRIERIAKNETELKALQEKVSKLEKKYSEDEDMNSRKSVISELKSLISTISKKEVEDDNVGLKTTILSNSDAILKKLINNFLS